MNQTETILKILNELDYRISTDTRKNLSNTVYFALKGDSFDGNEFVYDALEKGAVFAITDNEKNIGENIILVEDVLETLQEVAKEYRKFFNIPIIVIGGSNGKTTSKELLRDVLKERYKVHSTEGSFNNHFGVPLSIISMPKDTEIGVFEIGANHPLEHTALINIINPTHVVVTNNGMDHLEGFLTPEGSRKANKEIYDWAKDKGATVFVNEKIEDLMEDSKDNKRVVYNINDISVSLYNPLTIKWNDNEYKTRLVGSYNLENIELALSIGEYFNVDTETALKAIGNHSPLSKRSEFVSKNNINFIVDCYNANPTSMMLSLQDFIYSTGMPKGIILGDMLELGDYSDNEHEKIIYFLNKINLYCVVLIGENFKKAMEKSEVRYFWFSNSDEARDWFKQQDFNDFTFLLKGSRGIKVEKILDL